VFFTPNNIKKKEEMMFTKIKKSLLAGTLAISTMTMAGTVSA
jgi:hypothetical protein